MAAVGRKLMMEQGEKGSREYQRTKQAQDAAQTPTSSMSKHHIPTRAEQVPHLQISSSSSPAPAPSSQTAVNHAPSPFKLPPTPSNPPRAPPITQSPLPSEAIQSFSYPEWRAEHNTSSIRAPAKLYSVFSNDSSISRASTATFQNIALLPRSPDMGTLDMSPFTDHQEL
jgi:hypothetical protein